MTQETINELKNIRAAIWKVITRADVSTVVVDKLNGVRDILTGVLEDGEKRRVEEKRKSL